MTAPVFGYQGQLGVDTVSVSTHRFDFDRSSLACDETFLDLNGLRGTRARDISRVRAGNRRIAGSISLQPTAVELALLLPWILGGTPSGTTYPLADLIPTRYVMIDKGANVMVYNAVAVNKATFRASAGGPLNLTLDLVGGDESIGTAGTFPSLTLDTTTTPFILTDASGAGIAINGTNPLVDNLEVVIDNSIDETRFYNSQTLTAEIAMDRHITVNMAVPFGTASALYNLGAGGTSAAFTFTNAADTNLVLTFSFVKIAFPRKPIEVPGRAEIKMPFPGTAYKSSGTLELVTTLASSP